MPVFTVAQLGQVRSTGHILQIIRRWRVLRIGRYHLYLAQRGLFGVPKRNRPFGFEVGDVVEVWSTPGGYPLRDGMSEGMQVRIIADYRPGGYRVERDGYEWNVDQTNVAAIGKRSTNMEDLSRKMAVWRDRGRWDHLYS